MRLVQLKELNILGPRIRHIQTAEESDSRQIAAGLRTVLVGSYPVADKLHKDIGWKTDHKKGQVGEPCACGRDNIIRRVEGIDERSIECGIANKEGIEVNQASK